MIIDQKIAERVRVALDTVRSSLQADGGDVELVGFKDGQAVVKLKGACKDCPMAPMTLKMGIERVVVQEVPEVKGVIGLDVVIEESTAGDDKDAEPEADLVALALVGDQIKLVSLHGDGSFDYLDDNSNYHNILYLSHLTNVLLEDAVQELEYLVNASNTKEQDLQDFFSRNKGLLIPQDYKDAHSKIVLERETGGSLIPDFILEPVESSALCDLLDLKLPRAPIFVMKKNRTRFSAAVLEACAQLREYAVYFDEERHRRRIKEKYDLLLYRPRMFVIIGRRGDVDPISLRKMELDIPQISLRTYDDIIARAKARLRANAGPSSRNA